MSYSDAYQPPQFVPPDHGKPGPRQLDYMGMYNYIFENPNWVTNVLWGSLCILAASVIPILPQMVLSGYQWEIIETLHRRNRRGYPDFDTNRLGDYLGRGLWPMLVGLVAGFVVVMVLMVAMGVMMFITAIASKNGGGAVGVIMMLVMFACYLAALLAMNFVLVPMTIRAGLSQDFAQGFNIGWAIDFVKRTWVEMLLGSLFLMFSGMLLVMCGLLVFCVGMYPAAVIVMLAYAHFFWQLYEIYLQRGGEPVPLKG